MAKSKELKEVLEEVDKKPKMLPWWAPIAASIIGMLTVALILWRWPNALPIIVALIWGDVCLKHVQKSEKIRRMVWVIQIQNTFLGFIISKLPRRSGDKCAPCLGTGRMIDRFDHFKIALCDVCHGTGKRPINL
jgi:hypothetical protein